MNDRLLVVENGASTYISISAPNGLRQSFIFFTDPDTPEEAQSQLPLKWTQEMFNLAHEQGWGRGHYESPVRLLLIPAVLVSLALVLFVQPLVGVLAMIALIILVVIFASRHEKPVNEDRRWFAPISEKLTEFAKANDFRGALRYAIDATGCTK